MSVRSIGPAKVSGSVVAPPSKSYTHRSLVAAFLADGASVLERPLESGDTHATRTAIATLGRAVRRGAGDWTVSPRGARPPVRRGIRINCGQSGTTLRFLSVLAATMDSPLVLDGEEPLAHRPIRPLLAVLRRAGAKVLGPPKGRSVPFAIRGPIRALDSALDSSQSSQFLSALLMVLPTLDGDSVLRLRGPLPSRPYVAATLDVMRRAGVRVRFDGRVARIPGGQRYRSGRTQVPGDASAAAYVWAAGAVAGGPVEVHGVAADRPQADLEILNTLDLMGAEVRRTADGARITGSRLSATRVELTDAPDLYPLVGVLAAIAAGDSRLEGAAHVVHKESDRRRATIELARFLGAHVRLAGRTVLIRGRARPRPVHAGAWADHRVVMSAAVAALAGPSASTIGDADCVAKSFPGFWTTLASLGARSRRVSQ